MPKESCLVVFATGRQLDLLRGKLLASPKKIKWTGISTAPTSAHAFALRTLRRKKSLR